MTIVGVIESLGRNKKPRNGLQLTKRKGILTSTWVLYKQKSDYYYFDICEDFIFDENHRYTYVELLEEFKNDYFEIDMEVV
jgi:hypothetical protein